MGQALVGQNDDDQFGSGVSVATTRNGYHTLAVGIPGFNSSTGQVRFYRYDAGLDIWHDLEKPLYGETTRSVFGRALELSNNGTVLAVGVHLHG